jgi:hypothetical protein
VPRRERLLRSGFLWFGQFFFYLEVFHLNQPLFWRRFNLTVANGPPGQQEFLDIMRDAVEAGPVTRVKSTYLMPEGGELMWLGIGGS